VTASNLGSGHLTLQAQSTVGLIASPVQGAVLPLQQQTTIVTQQTKESDDKGQRISQTIQCLVLGTCANVLQGT
ncbi:jg521, partial [Pararge aegeria aegeria]